MAGTAHAAIACTGISLTATDGRYTAELTLPGEGFSKLYFGKADQADIAGLQVFVLLGEDAGLVVELIHRAGQLIDISTNEVGRSACQSGFQSRTCLGDGYHQLLGIHIGGSLDRQLFPSAVFGQNGLDADDGPVLPSKAAKRSISNT